ncbi:hypothetical protein [Nonomuraea sp. NPDC049309]|uniref:hypothetical protein n=1 Tax=Nonomuraea sp. NPDC049309 TaxID=3364350 RepID=UPI0037215A62
MDTTALEAAYTDLIAAARAIGEPTPEADWTLSHIALSDRMLATAARRLDANLPVTIDNRPAMDADAIAALIASTTHAERIDLVRRHGADLVAAIGELPEAAATVAVRLRLITRGGEPAPDQDLTWGDLVRLRVRDHLPGHAARLSGSSTRSC